MYSYELNIPLEGLGTANIPRPMNNVYFQNIGGVLNATTKLESESKDEIPKQALLDATNLLHEAVLRLNFVYRSKITLSKTGYTVKKLFDHEYPWRVLSSMSFSYSIGIDHDKLAEDISHLSSEMNSILNKALGYYEAAMESTNPYVKTILLVSCASALIKELFQIKRDIELKDLKAGLEKIRISENITEKDFHNLINNIYGSGRSRAAHGNVDIKSDIEFSTLTNDYHLFHKMVHELLEDFIKQNQGNTPAVPKI